MPWRILSMADITACPDVFDVLPPLAKVETVPPDRDVLLARIADFDGYFCSLRVRIDEKAMRRAPRLRVITTPSTGLDHIDLDFAAERGIEVLTLKYDTDFLDRITATAELAWALLLATVRRIPWGFESACRGVWARDRYRGRQLSGKTLGILGYGRLGRMMAEYGNGFRMRVIACDVRDDVVLPENVIRVDFDTLLRQADVLSLHIHLTEENRGLIDAAVFAKMKPSAFLINTSRGAIIDETAFVHALETGRIAGAGVDVIEGEWDPNIGQHPLIRYAGEHENLVISPHVGGVTFESQRLAYEFSVQKLKTFLEGLGPPPRRPV